jgi:uncharacterized protein YbjT (DUF2867 family)
MARNAVIAGHTGLVGRHLLQQLLVSGLYARVLAVGRREPAQAHPALQVIRTELGELQKLGPRLAADDAFCCLGTTLRAAGSKAAFERVDFHMVVDFARAVRAAGATRLFVVSSLSADPRSPVYYSRVKGRTEQALREVGFEALHIVRPSLLLGERSASRPGEDLAQRLAPAINPLLFGPLRKYRAIRGEDVARALLDLARRIDDRGVAVHTLPLD